MVDEFGMLLLPAFRFAARYRDVAGAAAKIGADPFVDHPESKLAVSDAGVFYPSFANVRRTWEGTIGL